MVKEKVDVFGIVPTQTGYFTAEKDKEEGMYVLTTWLPDRLLTYAQVDALAMFAHGKEIGIYLGARWHILTFYATRLILLPVKEAGMQTMNISLPEPLKEFVDGQIASGRYSSASEYIRELIREDEKHKAEERLEALLLEGLQGKETAVTRDDLNAIRKEALATLKARKHRR